MALLLGHSPIALTQPKWFATWGASPSLPPGIVDIGTASEPNIELLIQLAPDLILLANEQGPLERLVQRLAPTLIMRPDDRGQRPYLAACSRLAFLAQRLEAEAEARAAMSECEAFLALCSHRLKGYDKRPVYILQYLDQRSAAVVGTDSPFDDVLASLGLTNAWPQATASIGIGTLAENAEARVVLTTFFDIDFAAIAKANPIWRLLPFAHSGRYRHIAPVWSKGNLGAAKRFAGLLTDALLQPDYAHA